jgi:hypothetical protein
LRTRAWPGGEIGEAGGLKWISNKNSDNFLGLEFDRI